MNREQVAKKASEQFRQLRIHDSVRETYLTKSPPPTLYLSSLELIKLQNQRAKQVMYRDSEMAHLNIAARALYAEYHAELYEMAREDMEDEGVAFNFADHRAETVYRFGEDIAAIEDESPLNALGAKIIHLGQLHGGLVDEALA